MSKKFVYVAKPDAAAEWAFYPNAKTRKLHPDAELDFAGMEIQDGELVSLTPKSPPIMSGGKLVLEIAEGRVELIEFKEHWQEGALSDDAVIWDAARMVDAWSSDD